MQEYITRIREHDSSLFGDDVSVQGDIAQCLGWTTLPQQASALYPLLDELTLMADERKITDVVLLGMGGSILAASVFGEAYRSQAMRTLHVLDTTCPEEVISLARTLDFTRTLFIIASKSGSTLETVILEQLFWDLAGHSVSDKSQRATYFIAITDPATPLEARARRRGYTLVYSPRDVGGRFSAFSVFGLVPCALVGIDCQVLVEEAINAQHLCEAVDEHNPVIVLASEIWEYYQQGADKLLLPDTPFSLWLGQLLAESLGKQDQGIVPIVGSLTCCCTDHVMPCPNHDVSASDSLLPSYGGLQRCCREGATHSPASIAYSMVVWEWVVTLLGVLMGVNPFDQPDVARAKKATEHRLDRDEETPRTLSVDEALALVRPHDYVCVLAYVNDQEYQHLKYTYLPFLAKQTAVPICLERGPCYLHSIGQVHKGGANTGVFIVIDNQTIDSPNVSLPKVEYTLRELFDAQRLGDVEALVSLGRRVALQSVHDLPTFLD